MFIKKKLKLLSEKKGKLLPISFENNLHTKIKRIFFISGNLKFPRGNHAHKKCTQTLIQLVGSSKVELKDKKNKKNFFLNEKNNFALVIKPKTWVEINFKSKKNLIAVLCSHEYDKSDYIYDFNKL